MKKLFSYLEGVIVMKMSPLIYPGMAFEHVGARRVRTEAGLWVIPLAKYTETVLELLGMQGCNPSTSPKLDKKDMDGDREPCADPATYRSAVCTALYLAKRRPDLQSTVRWLCKRLKEPDVQSWRQLVKMARYMKGTKDMATFYPAEGPVTHIGGYLDGDWACDDIDRKSVSGAVAMVAGCRMHSHSRGTVEHALSSGESEIISMFEMLKDCLLLQYNLEDIGFGRVPIVLFIHRRHRGTAVCASAGRWAHEALGREAFVVAGPDGQGGILGQEVAPSGEPRRRAHARSVQSRARRVQADDGLVQDGVQCRSCGACEERLEDEAGGRGEACGLDPCWLPFGMPGWPPPCGLCLGRGGG